jgi:hypothetical protein
MFFFLQTANVAYFQRKIQSSGVSTYPDVSPSQLIRISGVLLYLYISHTFCPAHLHPSSTTFQNLFGISDLISEVSKFQHNTFKAVLPM